MKNRNPLGVFLLTLITFGIYGIVWEVKTKNEMNSLGASIPTAWLLIIPFVNIYWLWKYSEGVGKVTNGQLSPAIAFILLFFLGVIGMVIIQLDFNKIASPAEATAQPEVNPPAPTAPTPQAPTAPPVV